MKRLALIAVAVLGGGWLLLRFLGAQADEEGALAPESPSTMSGQDEEVRLEPVPAPETTGPGRSEVTGSVESGDDSASESDAAAIPQAVVRGILLQPDDVPAIGVEVVLECVMWSNAALARTGEEPPRREFVTATEGTGRFEIRFPASPQHHYDMKAMPRGFAEVRWRWGSHTVEESGEIDVGIVSLRPTGAIEGFVVDESGVPIPHQWALRAVDADSAGADNYRNDIGYTAHADPHTGAFLFEGLPAGLVDFSAVSQVNHGTGDDEVQVPAHGIVRHDLVYRGPDPRRSILLHYSTRPSTRRLGNSAVRVHGERYDTDLATSHEINNWSFEAPWIWIENLPPGLYTVTVADEHFEPWAKTEVPTGETLGVDLLLRSGIRLAFDAAAPAVDDATRAMMTHALLVPRWRKPDRYPLGPLPSERTLIRIPPGDSTLVIERPDCLPTEVSIEALAVGEVRDITVALPHP